MRNRLLPSLLASSVIILSAVNCKKHVDQQCIQAKIIRITCAGMVIQALNNNAVGEDNWKDMFNGNTAYDNVFGVSNTCKIPSAYKTGDTIYVTVDQPVNNNCIHCALYDAPPATSYDITSIGTLSCSESLK